MKGQEASFRGATLLDSSVKDESSLSGTESSLDTPGSVNTPPAAKPTRYILLNFRFAASRSIQFPRWRRLTPYPTLFSPAVELTSPVHSLYII